MQTVQPDQVVTTETIYSWINAPAALGLFFALAGAVFIGIYMLRRVRGTDKSSKA